MEDKINLEFRDDFPLLIETGFIAVKQLDEVSATRIFHGAQAVSPFNTAPQIGLGYIALNKLDLKLAIQIFETVLGICFLLSKGKRGKGEKLIREAMEKTTDPTVKNLGAVALEWAEKDLSNKSKAPFFNQLTQIDDKN